MKRFLLKVLIIAGMIALHNCNLLAQPYNNEWINYNNTYYKFKVGATGLYRISQATLTSIGLGSIPAEQFQLWRNGKEVPLYTTVQTGPFGNNDYIEFWGEMNDGQADNIMYRTSTYQLNDKWSLQTDTAAFFLTVNTTGANLRLEPTINDVAGNLLAPEPYFIYTKGNYYKSLLNRGYAAVVGEYVYSSAYDIGEGWTSSEIYSGNTPYPPSNLMLSYNLSNLNVYSGPGAPEATYKINASGNALNQRNVIVKLNGDTIINQAMDFFDYIKGSSSGLLSKISSGTASIEITNNSPVAYDRFVVATDELIYPRTFDFDNTKNFSFELPANTNGNYLEISNFNYGITAPVLYDLSNDKRYVADISNPALIKIALLPSSVNRRLLLVNEEAASIKDVTLFQQRNFINFNLPANQGNYLIISHSILTNSTTGNDPIEDYRAYRSSVAGGSYNAKVYMIDELVDQFGLGIKKHPLSIRNFIRWARANFNTLPIRNVFLIGKGVNFGQYRVNESNPNIEKLCLVPTFGEPASDNLLAAEPGLDQIAKVPIGRLPVISGDEVNIYLAKVKQYEQVQAVSSPLIQDKAWMKNVVHVVGASDENLGTLLDGYMANYKTIISDTFYGANVHTFSKSTPEAIDQTSNSRLQDLFQEGTGLVTYFGHSSSTSMAFNMDNPFNYNNPGKYPVFILLGCNAGNFFNFNLARFQTLETISEKYTLTPQRGGVGCIASTHFGIVHYLDVLNNQTYIAASTTKYGHTLGEIMIEGQRQTFNIKTQNDYYARMQCEQATLNGDPAIKLNNFTKPDYVIEDQLVKTSPSFVSVADTAFRVDAKFMNIGKAINKNIIVEVKRTYPDGSIAVIQRDTIPGIRLADSLTYYIHVIPARDKGLNKITITVDADNDVDELYETNNTITKDVYVFEDDVRPVYPLNYAIVNKQPIKLSASTANPFAPSKQYKMEIDTTELFNSSLKVTRTVNSIGGLIDFDPGITFVNGTVYYWRVAVIDTGSPNWNNSSFIYLSNSEDGFNQSHYYQHDKSDKQRIMLDGQDRNWKFDSVAHFIYAKNGVYGIATSQEGDLIVSPDGDPFIRSACVGFSLIFNVFDPLKFIPKINLTGQYGSALPCQPSRQWNFEYSYMNSGSRKLAMDFMDSIPNGSIVVVRNILNSGQVTGFIDDWKADTTLYGSNNSLYHKLKAVGFNQLDSFYTRRSFIHIYRKGDNGFVPVSTVSNGMFDVISLTKNVKFLDTLGYITSPVFGPAKAWKRLYWAGNPKETLGGDHPTIDIIGIDQSGNETVLATGIDTTQQDYCLSCLNIDSYPYLKLKMRNIDSVNLTPYQLNYWKLTYQPVPEGAIAPNIYLKMKDTLEAGEPLDFKVAFKNISNAPFDSLKVKIVVTDKNNATHTYTNRLRPLLANGDTIYLHLALPINTGGLAGTNTLYVEANPDDDQPEQFHFNNFAYRNFVVKADSLNPLLDVTFDGVHILNRDLVSSKPDIVIKLKDETKWAVLDDTSLLTLQLRYPNGSTRRFYFNNDTLRFTAAGQAPNPDNTATVNFKPYLLADGEYELLVTGKDKSGNTAGTIEYRVAFEVINKPMISNMLNYPNPFTSSTAFVFTITGSQVPQNIKVEIMTITGKIVREITKDELGPLHIGRNITEFKWDGTDQYGQRLANGIYLYRVVTNLNGKALDKYSTDENNTDKYFNKGYGKMYLMR